MSYYVVMHGQTAKKVMEKISSGLQNLMEMDLFITGNELKV